MQNKRDGIRENSQNMLVGSDMNKLIKAAGCSVEAYWPTLFAKMLENKPVADMLKLGGGGGGGAAPAAGAAAGGAAAGGGAAAEAAPVEEEEEEEMEFDLFD